MSGDARESVRRRPPGDRAGVRDHGVPAGERAGSRGGRSVTRTGSGRVPAGRDRGEAGRQAGEGHRAAGSRRAEHGAARRGPDRVLPGPRPAARSRERWSRKHAHTQRRLCERFAAPVIGAVTCQDIKTGHMQQIVNAAPDGRGRRPGARDDLRAGRGGDRGRVPDQPAAGQGALAGRGPPAARPAGDRVAGSRRCGSTPPRSRPTATSASSAGRWPRAGTGSGTS